MSQQDAQLFLACLDFRPLGTWVLYMVEVVNRLSAGDGIFVFATAVLEKGVEGEDREPLLQFRFQGFKLFLGQLATLVGFQGIFYLGTCLRHLGRIECLIKEVGRTFPNLASYLIGYSEHFFDL